MAKVFLLLGGNLGNKKVIFNQALALLEEAVGKIEQQSAIYETEPWGFESEDLFWNQVVVLETRLDADSLLVETQQIEYQLGRVRHGAQYSSRLIDLDILFYDQLILNQPRLEIPHPRMGERRFVLEPLAEIAPDFIHPASKKTIAQLLAECTDQLAVKKLDA
ncbi:2-amino-4-hydroxy-6-hydroxymethyldihydropteridine diphosphokinase [uncultured Sunxiuqinia sp.]|uniref:2-amino-4-hydroxy-6- hydroxymethyldihydropteridine diphosphokinase n=1 Tax=uncultured Sunxiuqinia sp. TaxID=1573825 RepID=UPI0026192BA1|nr:2-amino-4-hydroxy-6-hydroxymethyldihydropteridine diphosphokinase [uncultured Sunxiuqinia sp.]